MVRVNLQLGTERDHLVKYNPFQPITFENETISVNNVNFHIPILIEEVRQLPKKEQKEYKKQIQTFLATASMFMIAPLKSMAQTQDTLSTTTSSLPKSAEGMPPEIMELLIGLLVIAVGAGVILAAILLVSAGISRMFRWKNASSWTVDIIKGFVQILIAVPVIFVIYYVSNMIFADSGWFINPFKNI